MDNEEVIMDDRMSDCMGVNEPLTNDKNYNSYLVHIKNNGHYNGVDYDKHVRFGFRRLAEECIEKNEIHCWRSYEDYCNNIERDETGCILKKKMVYRQAELFNNFDEWRIG